MKLPKSNQLNNDTIEQKIVKAAGNKLVMAYQLRQVKLWEDASTFLRDNISEELLRTVSWPLDLKLPISYPDIKKLAEQINKNILHIQNERKRTTILDTERIDSTEKTEGDPSVCRKEDECKEILSPKEEVVRKHNKKFVAKLFPFQQRTSDEIVEAIVKHKQRAQLLRANAGVGKTYMLFDVVEHLQSIGFFDSCISPWPVVYITKPSIITQTERVGRDKFGLDMLNFCPVISYDALRSSFGTMYIKWDKKVVNGEVDEQPRWRKNIHPRLFIVDECQAAMREQSQQTKIICALSELEEEIYIIFSSATPFTTVSRSKYFVINTGLEIK